MDVNVIYLRRHSARNVASEPVVRTIAPAQNPAANHCGMADRGFRFAHPATCETRSFANGIYDDASEQKGRIVNNLLIDDQDWRLRTSPSPLAPSC
jgi:hypothetical protein